ncbi:metal-dependent transcriptional regulator [Neobacillus niacini]|uniref:metal-dependent transcriptional regulator n=1 Tax=Neobacillus niacini TaxID=86668 RepID=UPI0021CB3164|nr:iron dependent repressor, metal binding and dimerization domain protein [Neobacillus niacini]MCM3766430.1 MarR family transcriptional regulator [Neobacillus niacini]
MASSVMKQYLKQMYLLADATDRVVPSQLANVLGVNPATVSKMVRKLSNQGWVKFEHYGRVYLTCEGKKLGKTLVEHSEVLEQFFNIIRVEDDSMWNETNDLEFYISPNLIQKIEILTQYFHQDTSRIQSFNRFCSQ